MQTERESLLPRRTVSRKDRDDDSGPTKDQILQILFWRRGSDKRWSSYRDMVAMVFILTAIIAIYAIFGDYMFYRGYAHDHILRHVPAEVRVPSHFFGRIFLVGDSSIRGMLPGDIFGETYDWKQQKPMYTSAADWDFMSSFRHRESPTQRVRSRESHIFRESFLLGNSRNASAVAIEMSENFKPTRTDIMVLHFGNHAHDHDLYRKFIADIYNVVVAPFPGQAFWIEPFPQHYNTGTFVSPSVNNETSCVPMDESRNATQFWRVQLFRDIVLPSENIHVVPAYDAMVPNWREHIGNLSGSSILDCTHYREEGYSPALRALEEELREFTVVSTYKVGQPQAA